MNFFNPFSPVFKGIRVVYQLVGVSLIWLIFCLPIVTAGAATSALYDTVSRVIRQSRGYLFRTFFKSFVSNFGQATRVWLLFLGVACAMSFNIQVLLVTSKTWMKPLLVPAIVLCIWLAVTLVYYLTLLTVFDNSSIGTLKNALVMGILHLPLTVLLMAITAGAAALAYIWPMFALVMPAVTAIIWSLCLGKKYQTYIEDKNEEDVEEMEDGIRVCEN